MSSQPAAWSAPGPRQAFDRRRRLILVGLPLASGASLVLFIVIGMPLPVALAGLITGSAVIWAIGLRRATSAQRSWIVRRVRVGAIVGLPAIVAYDLARFGLVSLASLSFEPFHVLPLFGHAILGPAVSESVATLAGLAFHLANGMGFAIAFGIAVPRPSILKGVAWALALEVAMLALYPGWLGLSLTGELVPVSAAGHLAYGGVLGELTARLLR